jgi:V/A-type H+-transporting ATPase subunit I
VGFFDRVAVIKGYVRERDLAKVSRYLGGERGVAAVYEEPTPGEEVPVSLRTARFFGPAQFLVRMFGLPPYFSFDPTPYLTFSFLLFFGICFGDAIYGIAQVVLALWLARKVREYASLRQMFLLFAYAGVATIVMGVLTGSWCANLYDYLGEGNLLLRVKQATAVFDPLDKPVIALVIALGLGVANQLWAMVLRMYGSLRQRDYAGAVFDSGLWLIYLPGLVLLISAVLMVSEPAWVKRVGLWLVAIGGVGLVLTQGRNEKTFFGKALTGVVSLYGILGTYGSTSFIGDVLSYCRLLALALTTTIVGWSFNIVADLLRGSLGWWGFIPVVVLGHTFNFFISILTGFVHSARLIFVEFFGRFYSGGAPAFVAFGREQGRVRLLDGA